MYAYRMVWEDEAKGREIELFVHYRLEAGAVTVREVRPTQVTLYTARSQRPARSLPVHTATGRRLLAQAFLASRETEQPLEEEILAAHAFRDDALVLAS